MFCWMFDDWSVVCWVVFGCVCVWFVFVCYDWFFCVCNVLDRWRFYDCCVDGCFCWWFWLIVVDWVIWSWNCVLWCEFWWLRWCVWFSFGENFFVNWSVILNLLWILICCLYCILVVLVCWVDVMLVFCKVLWCGGWYCVGRSNKFFFFWVVVRWRWSCFFDIVWCMCVGCVVGWVVCNWYLGCLCFWWFVWWFVWLFCFDRLLFGGFGWDRRFRVGLIGGNDVLFVFFLYICLWWWGCGNGGVVCYFWVCWVMWVFLDVVVDWFWVVKWCWFVLWMVCWFVLCFEFVWGWFVCC